MEEEAVSYKSKVFFEKQNEKDCLIHSINNAFGKSILTKDQVLDHIRKTAEKIHAKWCCTKEDPHEKVQAYLDSVMLDKNTMFSAEVIWRAAVSSKAVRRAVKIPGFSSRYSLKIPDWVKDKPVVILGEAKSGMNHAIALRKGMIFDSENPKPVPYTPENLAKSLVEVHAAYTFE